MSSKILYINLCASLGHLQTAVDRSDYERTLDLNVHRGVNGNISWIAGEFQAVPRGKMQFHLAFDGYGDASTREALLSFPEIELEPFERAVAYLSILHFLAEESIIKVDISICRHSLLCEWYGRDALERFDLIDRLTRQMLDGLELPHHAPSLELAAALIQRIANR